MVTYLWKKSGEIISQKKPQNNNMISLILSCLYRMGNKIKANQ